MKPLRKSGGSHFFDSLKTPEKPRPFSRGFSGVCFSAKVLERDWLCWEDLNRSS